MRASLDGIIDVVGEFPTLKSAEAARIQADGVLLAPNVGLNPRSISSSKALLSARPPSVAPVYLPMRTTTSWWVGMIVAL